MRFIASSKISGRNLPAADVGAEFPFTSLGFYLLAISS
jgi:hypothetical protein